MMTHEEANERCLKLAYELSKSVSKISEIRNSVEFIAQQTGWDDQLVYDFDDAMAKLSVAMAGIALWATEERFRKEEIRSLRNQAEALENLGNEENT